MLSFAAIPSAADDLSYCLQLKCVIPTIDIIVLNGHISLNPSTVADSTSKSTSRYIEFNSREYFTSKQADAD